MPLEFPNIDILLLIAQCLLDDGALKTLGTLGLTNRLTRQLTSHMMLQTDTVEVGVRRAEVLQPSNVTKWDSPSLMAGFCSLAFGTSFSGKPQYSYLRHLSIHFPSPEDVKGGNISAECILELQEVLQHIQPMLLRTTRGTVEGGWFPDPEPMNPFLKSWVGRTTLTKLEYLSGLARELDTLCLDSQVHCLYLHHINSDHDEVQLIASLCSSLRPAVLCFELCAQQPASHLLAALRASKSTLQALEIDACVTYDRYINGQEFHEFFRVFGRVVHMLQRMNIKHLSIRVLLLGRPALFEEATKCIHNSIISILNAYASLSRKLPEVVLSFFSDVSPAPKRVVKWTTSTLSVLDGIHWQELSAWRFKWLGKHHASGEHSDTTFDHERRDRMSEWDNKEGIFWYLSSEDSDTDTE